jgi:hypothetical protein
MKFEKRMKGEIRSSKRKEELHLREKFKIMMKKKIKSKDNQ